MPIVVYPKCTADDIRSKEIDLTNPLSDKDIRLQKGNEVCMICAPSKRVIAKGNRFDGIPKMEE